MLDALLGAHGCLLQTAEALSVAPVDGQAKQAHTAEHLRDSKAQHLIDDEAGGTCW